MDYSEELQAKGIEGGLVRKSRSLVSLYTRRRLVNIFNLGMSLLTTALLLYDDFFRGRPGERSIDSSSSCWTVRSTQGPLP